MSSSYVAGAESYQVDAAQDQVAGSEQTYRFPITDISGGWSTRTYPHLLPPNKLTVADNVVYFKDGLCSKRPGNEKYGWTGVVGTTGRTGSGVRIQSLARFYVGSPKAGHLVAQSGPQLWVGNDSTGAFATTVGATAVSTLYPCTYAQFFDPDVATGSSTSGAVALFVCDGINPPKTLVQTYTGSAPWYMAPVSTAAGFLPLNVRTNLPITPRFCCNWNEHLVYAGDPADPSGLWISDALRPQRFSGYSFADSAGVTYTPYYPGGRDGDLGDITGVRNIGANLIIFFTAGVVVGINTGSYGATQYQFQRISTGVGCTSPQSVVAFDNWIVWFGGDRFYISDGQSVLPLVDELPSVYSNTSKSANPPDIKNIYTVVGTRRGTMYLASYDYLASGSQQRLIMFDFSANQGFSFGGGGGAWARWLGLNWGCGVECRGPGDQQQVYWGSSTGDQVYQHDVGTYDDDGLAIRMELRSKSFFFNKPLSPKTVQGLYVLAVFDLRTATYIAIVTPYITTESNTFAAPAIQETVLPGGTAYGIAIYGTFNYGAGGGTYLNAAKTFPQYNARGEAIAAGVIESSANPFNCIGFVIEATIDPPEN